MKDCGLKMLIKQIPFAFSNDWGFYTSNDRNMINSIGVLHMLQLPQLYLWSNYSKLESHEAQHEVVDYGCLQGCIL